jgi:hypothetical protein
MHARQKTLVTQLRDCDSPIGHQQADLEMPGSQCGAESRISTVSVPLTAPNDESRLTSTRNDCNSHTPGPDHPVRPLLNFKHLARAGSIPPDNSVNVDWHSARWWLVPLHSCDSGRPGGASCVSEETVGPSHPPDGFRAAGPRGRPSPLLAP